MARFGAKIPSTPIVWSAACKSAKAPRQHTCKAPCFPAFQTFRGGLVLTSAPVSASHSLRNLSKRDLLMTRLPSGEKVKQTSVSHSDAARHSCKNHAQITHYPPNICALFLLKAPKHSTTSASQDPLEYASSPQGLFRRSRSSRSCPSKS